MVSSGAWSRTRSNAIVMIVADRDATSPARDRRTKLRPHRRLGPAGEPGPRQQISREGDPAPGLRDTDPQPVPQELGRVPAPVIHRIRDC